MGYDGLGASGKRLEEKFAARGGAITLKPQDYRPYSRGSPFVQFKACSALDACLQKFVVTCGMRSCAIIKVRAGGVRQHADNSTVSMVCVSRQLVEARPTSQLLAESSRTA